MYHKPEKAYSAHSCAHRFLRRYRPSLIYEIKLYQRLEAIWDTKTRQNVPNDRKWKSAGRMWRAMLRIPGLYGPTITADPGFSGAYVPAGTFGNGEITDNPAQPF